MKNYYLAILVTFFLYSFKSMAGEFWFQPEKAILYETSVIKNQRLVTKVFNISQSSNLCIYDKENSQSKRKRFVEAYQIIINGKYLHYRDLQDSFPETLIRLEQLPESCLHPLSSEDPETNFEALWHFYNEYYPSFKERLSERGLTWDIIHHKLSKKIHAGTTNFELFQILSEMLAVLRDDHTAIYPPDERYLYEDDLFNLREDKQHLLQAFQKSWNIPREDKTETLKHLGIHLIRHFRIIDENYLQAVYRGSEQSISDEYFSPEAVYTWGVLKEKPEIGYVRIIQELNFMGDQSLSEQFEQANQTIQKMMQFFSEKRIKGLIIDLRLNYGGKDAINNSFTSYLLDRKRLVQQVKPHYFGKDRKTIKRYLQPNPNSIRPSHNQFPIYVLTSQFTSSAGEILTLQLKALDGTIHIGYHTDGILADTYTRTLPNGWIYQLPFNKNLSHDGKFYEGKGIPPDIIFDENQYYLTRKYLENGQDIILDSILQKNT